MINLNKAIALATELFDKDSYNTRAEILKAIYYKLDTNYRYSYPDDCVDLSFNAQGIDGIVFFDKKNTWTFEHEHKTFILDSQKTNGVFRFSKLNGSWFKEFYEIDFEAPDNIIMQKIARELNRVIKYSKYKKKFIIFSPENNTFEYYKYLQDILKYELNNEFFIMYDAKNNGHVGNF